jgi:pyruvate,water dikinase
MLFRWVLRHASARVRDRENLRFERTRLFGHVRRVFLELGRRLHAAGHLSEARDIFFLEIDELLSCIAGNAITTKLKPLVLLRQAEFAEYRTGEPPPGRFTTRGIVIHGRPLSSVESARPNFQGDQRKGIGCSPGLVRGRVRRIVDPRNAVIDGREILVAEHTDPGWVLLFPSAAGLLVERGSLLSHSAIVAREIGLPTVVAIDGLTAWLNDGDQIEFDGSTGRVCRLAQAGANAAGHAPFDQSTQGTRLAFDSDRAALTMVTP